MRGTRPGRSSSCRDTPVVREPSPPWGAEAAMAEAGRAGGSSAATRRPVPRRAAGRGCAVQVSVIVPVHNSECWLDQCLKSVWDQDFKETMELSVFNDASKDGSAEIIEKWKIKLEDAGVPVIVGSNDSSQPRGVGFAKNQAVIQSSGTYLCFLDSDDVMMPQRVRLQHEAAIQHPNSIIGCQVRREPVDSTERYTRWINNLTEEQLLTQVAGSQNVRDWKGPRKLIQSNAPAGAGTPR